MSGLAELRDAGAGDLAGLYNADGIKVGAWCDRTGRALLGSLLYVRERKCFDFGGEEGTIGEGYDFACSECGFCCDVPDAEYCPYCGAKVMAE